MPQTSRDDKQHIARIVHEAPRLEELLTFLAQGHTVAFACDFSEIHSYLLPLADLKEGIEKGDAETFNRRMRYWYAARMLLEDKVYTKLLLPPYRAELSQKIASVNQNFLGAVAWLGTQPKETVASIAKALMDDPGFRDAMKNFEQSSDFDRARELLAFVKGHQKQLGVLLEIRSGSWDRAIDRLKKVWNDGQLQSSDRILSVDARDALRNCVPWSIAIEEARSKTQPAPGTATYRLNSYMDGWAIEIVRQANIQALREPQRHPLLILVSRSSEVQKATENQTLFRSPQFGKPIQCFWSPDTYLAYQVIMQIPDERNNRFRAVQELLKIEKEIQLGIWTGSERADLRSEVRSEDLETKVRIRVRQLNQEIENLSLYRAGGGIEAASLAYPMETANFLPTELISFVNELIHFVKDQQGSFLDACEDELKRLWQKMSNVDNQVSSLRSISGIIVSQSMPTPLIEPINGVDFVSVRLPNHSLWIRLKAEELLGWVRELIQTAETGNIEAGYLALYKRIATSENFNPEINLLTATLLMCLARCPLARHHLDAIQTANNPDMKLEVGMVRMALDRFQFLDPIITFERGRGLLKSHDDPRLWKTLSVLAWDAWRKQKVDQHLKDAAELAELAFQNVKETGQFRFECINNLAYYRIEQFDLGQFELNGLISTLRDFEAVAKKLPRENVEIPEILHTLGKLKYRIASHSNDHETLKSAVYDLGKATESIKGSYADIVTRDFTEASEFLKKIQAK